MVQPNNLSSNQENGTRSQILRLSHMFLDPFESEDLKEGIITYYVYYDHPIGGNHLMMVGQSVREQEQQVIELLEQNPLSI